MTIESPTNQSQLGRMQTGWNALLEEVLRRGFHGQAAMELVIHDGTITRIARTVNRIEK